ncbi:hypothetical protein LPTSP4_36350 [Leptospira ryugenii]|uniref:Uncharacterized protein n=1 Tax=Leptospira ryugenii TaxID=1917863 RepID=A0A2P2E5F1_9LEPT|nr:hypothetical protein [Leptospira ryugenii]GBF52097.1 hypothetical protein LPTSP4_36350 [Leptospira ryugenii]
MRVCFVFAFLCILSCQGDTEALKKEYGLGKVEFAKGNLDGAKKHFQKIISEDTSFEDVPLYLAKIDFYKGNFEKASKDLSELIEDDTYGYQAYLLKVKADYAYRKDRSVLLKEVGEALKKDSSNLDLLIIAAKLHEELGQLPQTILYYGRVINESDKVLLAHKELKKIYEKAGIEERVKYHTRKIELWEEEKIKGKKK